MSLSIRTLVIAYDYKQYWNWLNQLKPSDPESYAFCNDYQKFLAVDRNRWAVLFLPGWHNREDADLIRRFVAGRFAIGLPLKDLKLS